ncbi:MAG: short-chain dehydrogenase [Porticoccaceae bacterium]|nr:MAG: short-chain dehydrogenase [Porticoccaceae bacterium]
MSEVERPLAGRVALVTGASRGVGRGIALALAEQGASVYVVGRTERPGGELSGTIGETAAQCEARGGRGIPVRVDLARDEEIAALFQRIGDEAGRLDILVNNAIAIPEALTEPGGFWEKPLELWEMFDIGVRAAFVVSWHAARLMVPARDGLIAFLSGYVGATYTLGAVFGTTKAAVDRMARDMAIELKPHGVTAVSLWQNFTYTERALRNLERVPGLGERLAGEAGSSPEFPGRVIAALARDPERLLLTGGTHIVAELAERYGVRDVDGRQIPSLRGVRGTPIWGPV